MHPVYNPETGETVYRDIQASAPGASKSSDFTAAAKRKSSKKKSNDPPPLDNSEIMKFHNKHELRIKTAMSTLDRIAGNALKSDGFVMTPQANQIAEDMLLSSASMLIENSSISKALKKKFRRSKDSLSPPASETSSPPSSPPFGLLQLAHEPNKPMKKRRKKGTDSDDDTDNSSLPENIARGLVTLSRATSPVPQGAEELLSPNSVDSATVANALTNLSRQNSPVPPNFCVKPPKSAAPVQSIMALATATEQEERSAPRTRRRSLSLLAEESNKRR